MKENYKSWAVKIEDFDRQKTGADKIQFLLNFAVLAPSSHNSQPWRFEVDENSISIFLEESRRLLNSDQNDRQSFISIGCVIENILITAGYYGYGTNIQYSTDMKQAARIVLSPKAKPHGDSSHLIFSIPKRVTNRNHYSDVILPANFIKQIQNLGDDRIKVRVITDRDTKNAIADTALAASIAATEDKNFRSELSCYIKPNTTSSPIGMPCFGMGIPTPISFIAPMIIRFLNMNKLNHKKNEKLLKEQTSALVIIESRDDNKLNWMKVGQIYERIALIAVVNRLATAMWAAPIQIGEFYKDIQRILNSNFKPQALFRLGYPMGETKHSPRLSPLKL